MAAASIALLAVAQKQRLPGSEWRSDIKRKTYESKNY